ncbi:MAG TPA: hypothetical protein VKX96_03995 [Chloroflexota bacterium]|jgi:type II secretory pathway pseudopilin PulG|nr:hypothetical protein [Chloroflexota bacterium]
MQVVLDLLVGILIIFVIASAVTPSLSRRRVQRARLKAIRRIEQRCLGCVS